MVKKLFKYEFSHYISSLFPFFIIPPIAALLSRIIWIFKTDSPAFDIISGSSNFIFSISTILCFIMVFITAISRYYKNQFSAQGYLTMTLPVSESLHIFVKLTTAIVFTVLAGLLFLISECILMAGPNLIEVFKSIGYIFSQLYKELGFESVIFIIEIILAVICALVYNMLLYYSCISIGHLAKKNRILASFGVYFIYYIITQIIGTIFVAVIAIYSAWYSDMIERLLDKFTINGIVHTVMWVVIILSAAMSVLFFFINRYIMKRKLNLE